MSEHEPASQESVSDRDLALVEVLYGERLESDADLDEDGLAELGELRSMRSLFAQLPDASPPAGITAQLLSAATTEHRPARQRRETRQAQAQGGFWQWPIRPFVAHPGLAAAASVVVMAGVAGALYLNGGMPKEEAAQMSVGTSSADSPAPSEDKNAESTSLSEKSAAGEPDLDLDDIAAGFNDPYAPSRKSKKPAPESKRDSKPAPVVGRGTKGRSDLGKDSPRGGGARARRVESRGTAGKGRDDQDGFLGEGVSKEEDRGTTKVSTGQGESESEKKSASKAQTKIPDADLERWFADAQRLAKKGECRKALALVQKIRTRSSRFYDQRVAGNSTLRRCTTPSKTKVRRSKNRPSSL